MKGRKLGFTLLELLVVVAIIAILLVLLHPVATSVMERSRQSSCLARMRALGTLILQYPIDHNGNLLPALSDTSASGGTPWYSILDSAGVLPGKPNVAGTWNNSRNSIMACPSRKTFPAWSGNAAGATLHYGMNQFPGFLNRTGLPGSSYETLYNARYGYPKINRIKNPNRTFVIGEVDQTYNVQTLDNGKNAYPHSSKSGLPENGNGMNLFFYDGHGAFFKGRLPDLGDTPSIKAEQWSADQSYPFF